MVTRVSMEEFGLCAYGCPAICVRYVVHRGGDISVYSYASDGLDSQNWEELREEISSFYLDTEVCIDSYSDHGGPLYQVTIFFLTKQRTYIRYIKDYFDGKGFAGGEFWNKVKLPVKGYRKSIELHPGVEDLSHKWRYNVILSRNQESAFFEVARYSRPSGDYEWYSFGWDFCRKEKIEEIVEIVDNEGKILFRDVERVPTKITQRVNLKKETELLLNDSDKEIIKQFKKSIKLRDILLKEKEFKEFKKLEEFFREKGLPRSVAKRRAFLELNRLRNEFVENEKRIDFLFPLMRVIDKRKEEIFEKLKEEIKKT